MLKHYINHLKCSITTKRELFNKESEIDIEALLNLLEKGYVISYIFFLIID